MVCLESLCKVLGVLRKMISNGSWGSRKVGKSKVITRLDFCHWKTDSRANSLLTKLCWKGRDRGRFSSTPFCFIWKIVKYASVNSIRGWMQWEKVAADWDVTVGAKKPHQVARSKLNSKRDKRAKKLRFQTYMFGTLRYFGEGQMTSWIKISRRVMEKHKLEGRFFRVMENIWLGGGDRF